MTAEPSRNRLPEWRTFQPPAGIGVLDETGASGMVPQRDPGGNKGTFGTLLAICGSLDFLGASLLVGHAALRAGAGLVCLAVPASLQPLIAGRVAEATTLGLPETAPGDVDAVAAIAVLAGIAPGGGESRSGAPAGGRHRRAAHP